MAEDIKELKQKINELEEKELAKEKQDSINKQYKMKIVCSCGNEQSIDDYSYPYTIKIDGSMSCYVSFECNECGKYWSRCFWC